MRLRHTHTVAVCLLLSGGLWLSGHAAAAVASFDDIAFWAGAGANRAALVLDWEEDATENQSLVWGYRWDGNATGADMLQAIVAADDRLFAKLGNQGLLGLALYGLGYDLSNDGAFAITDATTFDGEGIALTGPAEFATSVDPGDLYREGWFAAGFWHYGSADANPFDGGAWVDNPSGASNRPLTDGSWDGWTFSPTFDFNAFPTNPIAASGGASPDLDADGDVDLADLLALQRGFDPALLSDWESQFGTGSAAAHAQITVVPEPATVVLFLACTLDWIYYRRRRS